MSTRRMFMISLFLLIITLLAACAGDGSPAAPTERQPPVLHATVTLVPESTVTLVPEPTSAVSDCPQFGTFEPEQVSMTVQAGTTVEIGTITSVCAEQYGFGYPVQDAAGEPITGIHMANQTGGIGEGGTSAARLEVNADISPGIYHGTLLLRFFRGNEEQGLRIPVELVVE